MIVRLTHTHTRVLHAWAPDDVMEVALEHRRSVGRISHDYILPAIGWLRILDALRARAYGPLGGRRDDVKESTYTTIARIADVLARAEAHPALVPGRGVMGVCGDVVPAWLDADAGPPYSIYPPAGPAWGHDLMVLRPHLIEDRGRVLTYWRPGPSDPEDVTHQRSLHLVLRGRVDVGGVPEVGLAGSDEV